MTERNIIIEKVIGLTEIGLLALAVSYCTPSYSYDASYNALTDRITYENGSESDPMIVAHEQAHKLRAHQVGRFKWGILYSISPRYRCAEEAFANSIAGYEDIYDHPACDEFITSQTPQE
jgi:hypothetical protein